MRRIFLQFQILAHSTFRQEDCCSSKLRKIPYSAPTVLIVIPVWYDILTTLIVKFVWFQKAATVWAKEHFICASDPPTVPFYVWIITVLTIRGSGSASKFKSSPWWTFLEPLRLALEPWRFQWNFRGPLGHRIRRIHMFLDLRIWIH